MTTVLEIFALIAYLNVDVTQALKWLASKANVTISGWGSVALSYVAPIITVVVLFSAGLLPGTGWFALLLWTVAAVLTSNGVYKFRTAVQNPTLNG